MYSPPKALKIIAINAEIINPYLKAKYKSLDLSIISITIAIKIASIKNANK